MSNRSLDRLSDPVIKDIPFGDAGDTIRNAANTIRGIHPSVFVSHRISVDINDIKDAFIVDGCTMLIARRPGSEVNVNMRDYIEASFKKAMSNSNIEISDLYDPKSIVQVLKVVHTNLIEEFGETFKTVSFQDVLKRLLGEVEF